LKDLCQQTAAMKKMLDAHDKRSPALASPNSPFNRMTSATPCRSTLPKGLDTSLLSQRAKCWTILAKVRRPTQQSCLISRKNDPALSAQGVVLFHSAQFSRPGRSSRHCIRPLKQFRLTSNHCYHPDD